MEEEQVDIVDKFGTILYSTSKQDAHTKGLLHKTVIAELIASSGKMVLVRPRSHKQDAGQYVSPVGGHVRTGESDEVALRRETIEEVGLKPLKFKRIGAAIFNRFVLNRQENHLFIVYEIYTDELPVLGDEGADFKAFSRDEITSGFHKNPRMFGEAFHFVVSRFYPDITEPRTAV